MSDTLVPQLILAGSTLTAAILGYVLAGMNEARRDSRAAAREKANRAEERHAAALDAQHAFQLETLLALQDAIQVMARLNGRLMYLDHINAREGNYNSLLPEDLNSDLHANGVEVIRLCNRILDADLRERISTFEAQCASTTFLGKAYEGVHGIELESLALREEAKLSEAYKVVMEHLGDSLRTELARLPDT